VDGRTRMIQDLPGAAKKDVSQIYTYLHPEKHMTAKDLDATMSLEDKAREEFAYSYQGGSK
jgi:hypothetical protein